MQKDEKVSKLMELEIFFVNMTSVIVSFAPSSTVFDIMREVCKEKGRMREEFF